MSKRRQRPAVPPPPPAPRAGANGHAPSALKPAAAAAAPVRPGALSGNAARQLLALLLVVSAALSVLFAARVPFDANPDEAAHRDYVRLIIQERGFVRFREQTTEQIAAGEPARYETHQPPLFYLLAAPVYVATNGNTLALRLVSVLPALLTILVAFRAGRDLFPGRPEIALGAAAFVALLPTQAQLAGAINNDALTTLICAALFWQMGRLAVGGQSPRGTVVTGVLLGLGLLTKSTVLTLLPALALAHVVAVRARLLGVGAAAGRFAVVLGVGMLLASPWLVRNMLLYGDPLALSIYAKTGPNFTPTAIMQVAGWTTGDYARNVGARSFATFWYFLSPNLPFSRFAGPFAPLVLVLVLALGGLLGAVRWLREGDGEPGQRRALGLFLLAAPLLAPFFVRFVLTVFQAQGRYFLPVLLPVAFVSCLGWATLAGPKRRVAGALGAGGVLLVLVLLALGRGGFLA